MSTILSRVRALLLGALVISVALAAPACGGASGGPGPGGSGQGLVLVAFQQAGIQNVPLNRILEFQFSEAVDEDSVFDGSIQIREGSAFGKSVFGTYVTDGAKVYFKPRLAGACDGSDGGLKAGTEYRVQVVGYPEQFTIKNTKGQPLDHTTTWEFKTRLDGDPELYEDAIPGQSPRVVSVTYVEAVLGTDPVTGDPIYQGPVILGTQADSLAGAAPSTAAAVGVGTQNEVVVAVSENVDPCSVSTSSVILTMHQIGDLNGVGLAPNNNPTGFNPATDSDPDPEVWNVPGPPITTLPTGQSIPCQIVLDNEFGNTHIHVRPIFGEFPDNCLLVLELTFGIVDYGGLPMFPIVFSFTTENRIAQQGSKVMEFDGDVPFDDSLSSADVNTARSPSKVQGYLLFAGDGDNGGVLNTPQYPDPGQVGCNKRLNAGAESVLDPSPPTNFNLDTGSTVTACVNDTDGSNAVVWEFASIHLRSGVTVRITGRNPAILLSLGDVIVENGAVVLVRGDGSGGSPQGRGGTGNNSGSSSAPSAAIGGTGVAGGGKGGNSKTIGGGVTGDAGTAGYGSPGAGTIGGAGGGKGNVAISGSSFSGSGCSPAGGGGGHATVGLPGMAVLGPAATALGAIAGQGGDVYPTGTGANKMLTPVAGSGGGAAGYADLTATSFAGYDCTGGAGGAGGGFLDVTSNGDIKIFGTIDAAGSRGGNGTQYSGFGVATGGGGGGSGGGIRLLTPSDIDVTGATLTTAGGGGGTGGFASNVGGTPNQGGQGGNGRIVMEDGDSLVTGLGAAVVLPGEGQDGFYRSVFDASRFQGGGLTPQGVSEVLVVGPLGPTFVDPVVGDFVAGIPSVASRGLNQTGILVELRGYGILPDGSPDLVTPPTAWFTVGSFRDSGVASSPTWRSGTLFGNPGDVTLPSGNGGAGIALLNGYPYVQMRITFFLPSTMGPFDPGPYVDRWTLRYQYDQ